MTYFPSIFQLRLILNKLWYEYMDIFFIRQFDKTPTNKSEGFSNEIL